MFVGQPVVVKHCEFVLLVVVLVDPLIDVLGDWAIGCADTEEPTQLIKIKMTPMFIARAYLFIA
jgi:hypothetical protein